MPTSDSTNALSHMWKRAHGTNYMEKLQIHWTDTLSHYHFIVKLIWSNPSGPRHIFFISYLSTLLLTVCCRQFLFLEFQAFINSNVIYFMHLKCIVHATKGSQEGIVDIESRIWKTFFFHIM